MLKLSKQSAVVFLAIALAACSNSGPSRSEAAKSIKEAVEPQVRMLIQMFGNLDKNKADSTDALKNFDIEVSDIKCEKKGDDIFDCRVLFETKGLPKAAQAPEGKAPPSSARFEFTKLGGKWQAKEIK